jgi:hypothetical protein
MLSDLTHKTNNHSTASKRVTSLYFSLIFDYLEQEEQSLLSM